ncbi:MAG: hypothetical protein HC892_12385 [Saprospiraceae bacterium]|nr:hypothetical protein [Saprospiraceae bacterium]
MKVLSFFLLLTISANFSLYGQTTASKDSLFAEIKTIEDTLGILAYAIVNEKQADQRFLACRVFIPLLTKALKTNNSFDYDFSRLKTISILYPPDSSFRIFTWQLYVDTSEYRYYGAIQMNTKDLKLYPLIDRSFEMEDIEYEVTTNDKWYGSLYYNIKTFDTKEGKKYLLFGYDGHQFFNKRKVIEVLSFKDGKISFGAPVFVAQTDPRQAPQRKNRVIIEYSAESSVRCNYDEFEKAIVFDHLMAMESSFPGQKSINMPDGTFEGYRLKDGLWWYVPNMFTTTVNEPPRDFPILDQREKNIFGKKN